MEILKEKKLGRTQSVTREGYLLCEGVPVARCGELLYGEHELSGLDAVDGLIRVSRTPEDVFLGESVASFAGKPVILTHQGGEITAETWRDHSVGVVLNPRQGEGEEAQLLMADLLITDSAAIRMVRANPGQEVSAGYDADYEQLGPGKARQFNIFGNHVALVKQGRCGPRCSIGDEAMPTSRVKMTRKPLTMRDAILKAFRTGDAEMLERVMESADPGLMSDPVPSEVGTGDPGENGMAGHSITVNINGATGAVTPDAVPGADPAPGAPGAAPAPAADPNAAVPAWAQPLMDGMATINARLDAVEAAIAGDEPDADPDADPDPEEDPDSDPDNLEMKDAKTKDGMEKEMKDVTPKDKPLNMDAASLRTAYADVRAKAEVLVPGVKLITMDGKAAPEVAFKTLCDFKRRVLGRAHTADATAAILAPITNGKNFRTMACDSIGITFDAAAALVSAANRAKLPGGTLPHKGDFGGKAPTPADINKANRARFGYDA